MNLAYLSGTNLPTRAASALHVVKMAQAFSDQGANLLLYGYGDPLASQHALDEYYQTEFSFETHLFGVPRIRRGWGYVFAGKTMLHQQCMRTEARADAFYGRHPHALLAASYANKPVAYEVHSLPRSEGARRLEMRLFARRNLRALVCITKALADDYRRILDVTVPIHVIPDAADVAPSEPQRRTPWPGRPDALQVGYVGHLYRGKGMEVIRELAPLEPQADFHIIGGLDDDVERWRKELALPNVHLHGYVSHGELPNYYAWLDVALLPIQRRVFVAGDRANIGRWTSPLKAFEYMSYGLPIIASNVKVLHEIFVDGHNALFADPEKVGDWRRQLARLMVSQELRNRLGTNAKQTFLAAHTWKQRADKVLDIIS